MSIAYIVCRDVQSYEDSEPRALGVSLAVFVEMQRFYAATFASVLNNLVSFIATQHLVTDDDSEYRADAERVLCQVSAEAQKIGLTRIVAQADRIRERKLSNSTNDQISALVMELRDCLVHEMTEYLFLSIGPTFKWYYLHPEKQVEESVFDAFPGCKRDAEKAAQCLALDQPDASVFHSMRVLELGLNSLAKRFSVPYENKNWQNVIDGIETEIKKVNSANCGANWKIEERFYSEAALQLRWLKNAWRNHTMHLHETYEMTEAGNIFFYVRTFMAHLSSRLKESGGPQTPVTVQ